MPPELIRIDGLKEFNRSLKRMDKGLPKAVRLASNEAADIVVREAKPRVPIGPGKGGHAASSIKAASTAKAARISAGGKRFPYYAWLDFGGRVGPRKSVKRPFLKSGRYIWKAYDDRKAEVEQQLATGLTEVARSAGLDPS